MISLFGFRHGDAPPGTFHSIDGILHCIGSDAGPRIASVAERFELVWATGWEEKANEYLLQILGMPAQLPVLSFDGRAVFGTAHWKLEAIGDYAGDRPLAWIDDNLDVRCTRWAEARATPTLLVQTDAAVGITDADVERLLRFADAVS